MPVQSCVDTSADLIENCPQGAETTIDEEVYVVNTADLIASPQPAVKTGTTTAENWLSVTGTFSFLEGKQFSRLEATGSPEYDADLGGERGSRSSTPTLMVPMQRIPSALGWVQKNKNANVIVVFKDGNGRWCQLGFKGRSATISKAPNKLSKDAATINITFESSIEAHYLPDNFTPQITPFAN